MTFAEYELATFGYEVVTTFWEDFSIADHFGSSAIKDTYKRSMQSWKHDVKYLTELSIVLNNKIWQHYEHNESIARTYDQLWHECEDYCYSNLKGDDLNYYYRLTD